MTEPTQHDSPRPEDTVGITDAGARRLLFGSIVVSILLGFAWGWYLYPTFEDPRIFNVIGLVLIAVVFFVSLFVGVRGWLAARK